LFLRINFACFFSSVSLFNLGITYDKELSVKDVRTKNAKIQPPIQGWQSHRRHFAIILTQAKYDAIMIWTNRFDFFAIIKIFAVRLRFFR